LAGDDCLPRLNCGRHFSFYSGDNLNPLDMARQIPFWRRAMQHHDVLERRYSLAILFVLTLFSLIGLSGFTPNNVNAKITWTPDAIQQTLAPGSIYTTTVAFTSSDSFTNAMLAFTPSLQDILTISPT
jgi:hypothetical protein